MKVVVEADGGSRGNPGRAGYGAVVYDESRSRVLAERAEFLGIETNNVAEYRGLIAGLTAARELGATEVAVRMDSKLVVEQMKGNWQVKHPGLRPLAREAVALRAQFESVTFEWIPRELNKHADRLANEAMDGRERTGGVGPVERSVSADPNGGDHVAADADDAPAPGSGAWSPPTGVPTRLLLVRHGATAYSPQHRFSGRGDVPLAEFGTAQAAALAARIAADWTVDAVVSSPLQRAVQTAEPIAAALGVTPERSPDFVELDFGAWEGMTGEQVRARYGAQLRAFSTSAEAAPPNGESMTALARRVRRGRDALIGRYGGQTVAVISHVSPIKVLLRLALDAPYGSMFRLHLDTASISVIDYFADGACSVRLVNDTAHLSALTSRTRVDQNGGGSSSGAGGSSAAGSGMGSSGGR
jgi:probable phosphoglycerate mutase